MPAGKAGDGEAKSPKEIKKVAATISHPVRSVLLNLLATRPGSGAAELAHWSGEPIGRVRRQLKILADGGLIGVQRQESRRGVAKRYYVKTMNLLLSDRDEVGLSKREQLLLNVGGLRLLFGAVTEAIAAGTLTAKPDYVVGNTPGEVDARGWKELADLHLELLERTQDVVASIEARLQASGEQPTIRFTAGVLLFESPPLDVAPDD